VSLSVPFFFTGAQSATENLLELSVLPTLQLFHIHLIHVYFESKYSEKLLFLNSNTEGFESTGFDILLYTSLIVTYVLAQ